tara:strand:+ start:535 stop:996 length:462 start_codon:yes stop_codon:yes gene_type:complete
MESMNEKTKRASARKQIHMGSLYRGCCIGLLALTLIGCGSLKKAAIVGSAAGLGATAGSVISGGVIAPIAASTMSASVASVVADQTVKQPTPTQPLEITGDATIVQEAPSNFFSLLQELVEMGGWLLILVILVPMVLGWILPGPLEKRKKKKN